MKKDLPAFFNANIINKIESLDQPTIKEIKKLVNTRKKYSKIKCKNVVYEVGDFLLVNSTEGDYYVGELAQIKPKYGMPKASYWPSIVIQLYIFKEEIDRKLNGLLDQDKYDSISNYEVFRTEKLINDYCENILRQGKLLSYSEYENDDQHSENSFFTRANYNIVKKLLSPPISEWETACICKTPMNPDQLYISCDKCNQWYHPKHCDLKDEEVNNISFFICSTCKNSQ